MRLLALVLVVVLTFGPSAGRAEDAVIRVGTVPNDTGSLPFYALDMGFFKKAGLSTDLQVLRNGDSILEALVGGSLDVGSIQITAIESAYKRGIPLVIIAPGAVYDAGKGRGMYLMVRNGVPIETAKDFEGKTVDSVVLKSIGQLATNQWIDQNGGDSSKVKYIEVPFSATVAALQQARFDAAIAVEPYATEAKPFAHVVGPDPLSAVGKYFFITAYVSTRAWADAHPDQIRRFLAAVRESGAWANKNADKSALILSKYTKTDIAAINASSRAIFADQLRPALVQPTIDLAARYKLIDTPFKADEIIYHAPH